MENFNLKIISKEGTLYDDKALSITSYNEKGIFDVLPTHANFIALIQKEVVVRKSNSEVKKIPFTNALIRVKQSNVEIYLGIEGISFQ